MDWRDFADTVMVFQSHSGLCSVTLRYHASAADRCDCHLLNRHHHPASRSQWEQLHQPAAFWWLHSWVFNLNPEGRWVSGTMPEWNFWTQWNISFILWIESVEAGGKTSKSQSASLSFKRTHWICHHMMLRSEPCRGYRNQMNHSGFSLVWSHVHCVTSISLHFCQSHYP